MPDIPKNPVVTGIDALHATLAVNRWWLGDR